MSEMASFMALYRLRYHTFAVLYVVFVKNKSEAATIFQSDVKLP